jgi:hypothetical protein
MSNELQYIYSRDAENEQMTLSLLDNNYHCDFCFYEDAIYTTSKLVSSNSWPPIINDSLMHIGNYCWSKYIIENYKYITFHILKKNISADLADLVNEYL